MRQREGGRYSFRSMEMMRECDNVKGVDMVLEARRQCDNAKGVDIVSEAKR
jgi:hypothetical protein